MAPRAGCGVSAVSVANKIKSCSDALESHAGTVVEIADLDQQMRGFFAHIESEAANWDGSTKPIRQIGMAPDA